MTDRTCRCPACNPMHSDLAGVGGGMGAAKRHQARRRSIFKRGRGQPAAFQSCLLCSGTKRTAVDMATRYLHHLRTT